MFAQRQLPIKTKLNQRKFCKNNNKLSTLIPTIILQKQIPVPEIQGVIRTHVPTACLINVFLLY
jgi:hypothetical protein